MSNTLNARLEMMRAYHAKWGAKDKLSRELRDKQGGITAARKRLSNAVHECLRAEIKLAKSEATR